MFPNFEDGEFLLTDKVSYRFGEAMRGDVVVFQAPGTEQDFIKRIIGLPGDIVMVKDGNVFINNKQLHESYLSDDVKTHPSRFSAEGASATVPSGSFFVLGDNRGNSLDSRSFGFINKNAISGKAWFVYWPPNIAGPVESPLYSL